VLVKASIIFCGGGLDIKSHSFIVRIWNDSVGNGKSVWRGSIEKVGSDRKIYFSHLDGVVRFIQDQIGYELPGRTNTLTALLHRIKDAIHKHRN